MPLYEYVCPACNTTFEQIISWELKDTVMCSCGTKATWKPSTFNFKIYSPFTKDGEGFSSVTYSPEEYKYRVKHNIPKNENP